MYKNMNTEPGCSWKRVIDSYSSSKLLLALFGVELSFGAVDGGEAVLVASDLNLRGSIKSQQKFTPTWKAPHTY